MKYTEEVLVDLAKNLNCEILDFNNYKTINSFITVKCNKCSAVATVKARAFSKGSFTCQTCGKIRSKKYTQEEIIKKINDLTNGEYSLEGTYLGNDQKVEVRHLKCNKVWKVSMNDFIRRGVRCPFCSRSKGEEEISSILTSMGVRYEAQKSFDDLVYKQKLYYDFYLPEYNACIEVDGVWHLVPYKYKFDEVSLKNFRERRDKDSLKTEFCLKNNIKLLRIPLNSFVRGKSRQEKFKLILERFLFPVTPSYEVDVSMLREAERVSKFSGCYKVKVGAVIAYGGKIISTGYNYPVKGFTPCSNKGFCYKKSLGVNCGDSFCPVLHAEEWALSNLSDSGNPAIGATLYCTHKPCLHCSKMIISSGIKRVCYINDYDSGELADELLSGAGVKLYKISI